MPTVPEAWAAGITAVLADNTLNRGGFADALRSVITSGLSNAEATAFIDAVAAEYNRLGLINNPTYNNLRGEIIAEGEVTANAQFEALGTIIGQLAEFEPVSDAAQLMTLREDRDNIVNALDRCDALITAEPTGTVGRLIKEILREGKQKLREYRQTLRDEIQRLTGDPDG